jgi:hypothetical protein
MDILKEAHHEWARRPDDQRYLTLEDLRDAVNERREQSFTAAVPLQDVRLRATDDESLSLDFYDSTLGSERSLRPTNWSFGQVCAAAGAPAGYMRKLPGPLAAINLQWGLERWDGAYDGGMGLLMGMSAKSDWLRCITSPSYGRIWDSQVVSAVERINEDGRWKIPAASYATMDPKRATTLYASDRDIFIFLVDDSRPIEVEGRTLFRGFFTWNSEVGSATFGITTFLYDRVCDNRIIWGATDVRKIKIIHRGGAPERFAYEGRRYMERFSSESARGVEETIRRASNHAIPGADSRIDGRKNVLEWLSQKGFTKAAAEAAVGEVIKETGSAPLNLLEIIGGITAHARTIAHADQRVDLETKAGRLLAVAR